MLRTCNGLMEDAVWPTDSTRRSRHLAAAGLVCLFCALTSSCALSPAVPWPEVGEYSLGMTYDEVLFVTGNFAGERKPPWPPESVSVQPPPGARSMRLTFTGQCVSAIEVTYTGACENSLTDAAMLRYGAPLSTPDGTYLWSDDERDVTLVTRHNSRPSCQPICTPTCVMTYRTARAIGAAGPTLATRGLGACRTRYPHQQPRWHIDPVHAFQRNALDALGYLQRADPRLRTGP